MAILASELSLTTAELERVTGTAAVPVVSVLPVVPVTLPVTVPADGLSSGFEPEPSHKHMDKGKWESG